LGDIHSAVLATHRFSSRLMPPRRGAGSIPKLGNAAFPSSGVLLLPACVIAMREHLEQKTEFALSTSIGNQCRRNAGSTSIHFVKRPSATISGKHNKKQWQTSNPWKRASCRELLSAKTAKNRFSALLFTNQLRWWNKSRGRSFFCFKRFSKRRPDVNANNGAKAILAKDAPGTLHHSSLIFHNFQENSS